MTEQPKTGPEAPHNLEANAREYFRNAESFREKHQERSMRECYEKALEFGRASETPVGLAIASEASLYLGHIHKTRNLTMEAIDLYTESVELGRKSGTPEGFYAAARAAWNLGNTLEEAGLLGLEDAFRDAIQLGRASEMQDGLEVGAKAGFNLALNMYPDEESISIDLIEEIAQVWREVIRLGRECGTTEGGEVAGKAGRYLRELLKARSKR